MAKGEKRREGEEEEGGRKKSIAAVLDVGQNQQQ